MHPQAKEKMKEYISTLLANTSIKENGLISPDSWEHVQKVSQIAHKAKAEWTTESGIISVMFNKLYAAINATNSEENKDYTGPLNGFLTPEKMAYVADDITSFIENIPRSYKLRLPLPDAPNDIQDQINLNSQISIVAVENTGLLSMASALSGSIVAAKGKKKLFLDIGLNGFCDFSLESNGVNRALAIYKLIIQQGVKRGLFTVNDQLQTGLISALRLQLNIPLSVIHIDDLTYGDQSFEIKLPLSLSAFIQRLEFTPVETTDFSSRIMTELAHAVALIANQERETERVLAAIEWLFESMVSDTDTIAFLQVCFGLEALLGEGRTEYGLTKTLADRCAYLVSDSIKTRNKIRDDFEKLYQIRSNLVHGTSRLLTHEEAKYYAWGKKILEFGIQKEILHLHL